MLASLRYLPLFVLVAVPFVTSLAGVSLETVSYGRLYFLYPVALSVALGFHFLVTLFAGPSFAERLARREDPNLPAPAIRYCRTVTRVWVCFFVFNAAIALTLALRQDRAAWFLYNGFLSYLLVAILLSGEMAVRKRFKAKAQNSGRIV